MGFLAARSSGRLILSTSSAPGVEAAPEVVDLGTRDPGPVEGAFEIRNHTSQPLQVTSIRTGCGCLAVVREGEPAGEPVRQLGIPAGQSTRLLAKVSLRPSGSPEFRTTIFLATDDPTQPEIAIPVVARMSGVLLARPSHWVVGNVAPGEVSSKSVQILDTGRLKVGKITRVESSAPDLVHIEAFDPRVRELPDGTKSLATVSLRLIAPASPGDINVQVSIYESGNDRPALLIPVTGRVAPSIVVSPDSILLPRRLGQEIVASMSIVCKNRDSRPFQLRLVDADGLNVKCPTTKATSHVVEVAWPGVSTHDPPTRSRRTIRLVAEWQGQMVDVAVPVTWFQPRGPDQ